MLLSKGWPFRTWTHSYLCWISSSTGYTFPYLNTLALLLDITLYRIYLSILEHIRTSEYYALLDIPFHIVYIGPLDIMLYWIYLSILEHIRTSTEYHALLDIPFHIVYIGPLDIMLYRIYLSILDHIRTSTGYHFLLDIPFHTWTHSYFYWISCSPGYTFPYLITFVLLLDIMFHWIYLSVLDHIRTSTGYTFPYLNTFVLLLNMLYVFNISRSTRKGASRNLGSKGVLHWFLRNIGRNARSLLSLSLEIINLHFKFGCTFIYCSQVLMRTSKVTYPIPCLPNNLI